MTAMPSPARQTYEADGFYVHRQPLIPEELMSRAVAGMDAVRAGVYETGIPPQESAWNPGDDPQRLFEMSHVANHAIRDLVSHPHWRAGGGPHRRDDGSGVVDPYKPPA